MRNVLLFMHMSLDGFVSGPQGAFDWAIGFEKAMNDELLSELVRTNDTVLTLARGLSRAGSHLAEDS